MNFKLISSDLDGTLLNSRESISDADNEAMSTLRAHGKIIVVNSGRTLYEMPPCVRENKNIDYFVCSNGAVVYNNRKEIVFKEYIPSDSFAKVFRLLKEYDTAFAVHENGVSVVDSNQSTVEYWTDHRASEYAARNFIRFSDIEEDFVNRYLKPTDAEMICCYFKYADELSQCTEKLSQIPCISTAASSGENIEIFNSSVNKGKTLLKLCEILDVDICDTVAVGDSKNDIRMLESSGYAMAVSNATDAVKACADEIICSCNENIMSYILERHL